MYVCVCVCVVCVCGCGCGCFLTPPLFSQHQQFDVKYVLLFYYYGGMLYTCLHDYLKALLFFTVVSKVELKYDKLEYLITHPHIYTHSPTHTYT